MMALRPMVVDQDNVVLGGNMRLKALQHLGFKEIPDTWVKKASELTDEEKRRFIIADNVSGGEWDWGVLQADWDLGELEDWGLEVPVWDSEKVKKEKYTQKVDAPIYEPKNKKPKIEELFNIGRYEDLVAEIEKSNVEKDIKDFLKVAASRHIVFNYENIADYYAHSSKEVQELMENSALVIIDFNKAIELGYIQLSDEVAELYGEQYNEE